MKIFLTIFALFFSLQGHACEISLNGGFISSVGSVKIFDFTSVIASATNCPSGGAGSTVKFTWVDAAGAVVGNGLSYTIAAGVAPYHTPAKYTIQLGWQVQNPNGCPDGCPAGTASVAFAMMRKAQLPKISFLTPWYPDLDGTSLKRFRITPTNPNPPNEGTGNAGFGYSASGVSIFNCGAIPGGGEECLMRQFPNVPGTISYYGTNAIPLGDQIGVSFTTMAELSINPPSSPANPCVGKQTCGPTNPPINNLNGPTNSNNPCNPNCPQPFNLASGAHWHSMKDVSIPDVSAATALDFTRTYTAHAAAPAGALGPNWMHNYETQLQFSPFGIRWIDETGGLWFFPFVRTSQFDMDLEIPREAKVQVAGEDQYFIILRRDGTKLYFEMLQNYGRLAKVTDRHGALKTIHYNSSGKVERVSTLMGGDLNFTYNAEGKLSSVSRTRDGLSHTYTYNADGRLATSTDFANKTHEYEYNQGQVGTNANGMLSSIKDPIGRVLSFTYYDDGRGKGQLEPGGGTRQVVYNDANHTTQLTDIDGGVTTYKFDENNHVIRMDLPNGATTFKEWDARGRLHKNIDELGKVTIFEYDNKDDIKSIKRPEDSAPTQYVLRSDGGILDITPPTGAATHFELGSAKDEVLGITRSSPGKNLTITFTRDIYGGLLSTNNGFQTYSHQRNAFGQLIQVYDARNVENRTYDSRNRLHTRTFASGRILTYSYDDYDRIVAIVDNSGPDASFAYDDVGRIISRTVTDGSKPQTTSYIWDHNDRLVTETDAIGRVTSYSYDTTRVLKGPSSITDPAGRVTSFTYDVMGRLIMKTDPNGAETLFGYNLRGDLTSVTDALGNVTSYEYDGNGRKTAEIRPSVQGTTAVQQRTEFTYDDLGQLLLEERKSTSESPSRFLAYEYDPFGRLSRKILKVGSTVEDDAVYTYEDVLDADLLKTANNNVANLNFSSEFRPPFALVGFGMEAANSGNPLGLIEDQFTVGRDVTGDIASITGASAGLLYTKAYDAAGRLVGVNAGAFKVALAYDGFGRRKAASFSDGKQQKIAYDLLNRITGTKWKEGSKNSVEEYLQYDLAGNIVGLARENARYALKYDAADQLIESKQQALPGVPDYNRTFGYDLAGNRTNDSVNGTASNIQSNFLLSNATANYQADEYGFGEVAKEISNNHTKNYFYRADGRIAAFSDGMTQANYFYDGLDRLIAKTLNVNGAPFTQSFVNLGNASRVLLGKAGDGSVTAYIDGQGPTEHLGEVKAGLGKGYIADHLGSVLNSPLAGFGRSYGLFGESTIKPTISQASSPVNFGFAGYSLDAASGQYHNGPRTYDSTTGRWGQQEPSGIDGPNLYWYAQNNPVTNVDPTGEFTATIHYSSQPWGSLTMVWNGWLPRFYTSGTVGDNGTEIQSGLYKLKTGQHPLNPSDGRIPYKALNMTTVDGSRTLPATRNGRPSTATGINFHRGNSQRRSRIGSEGCHVTPSEQWDDFISQFDDGEEDSYLYLRLN